MGSNVVALLRRGVSFASRKRLGGRWEVGRAIDRVLLCPHGFLSPAEGLPDVYLCIN